MKILAKIARRHDSDELPDRRELVEMDLFDTDRNPWAPQGGGADELWTRHDYDLAVPFYPPYVAEGYPVFGGQALGPIDLIVPRTSIALMFLGGTFDVISGAEPGGDPFVQLQLQAMPAPGGSNNNRIAAQTTGQFLSNAPGYTFNQVADGYSYSVLNAGTYQVMLWALTWVQPGFAHPVVKVTEMAATIALLEAGFYNNTGWGGTGG